MWCYGHHSGTSNNALLLTKIHTLFKFPSSLPNSLLLFQDSTQTEFHIPFICHISPGYAWLSLFLRLSLFLITLAALRSSNKVFYKMSFNVGLSSFFLNGYMRVTYLGDEDHRCRGQFSQGIGVHSQPDLPLVGC